MIQTLQKLTLEKYWLSILIWQTKKTTRGPLARKQICKSDLACKESWDPQNTIITENKNDNKKRNHRPKSLQGLQILHKLWHIIMPFTFTSSYRKKAPRRKRKQNRGWISLKNKKRRQLSNNKAAHQHNTATKKGPNSIPRIWRINEPNNSNKQDLLFDDSV